MARRRHRGGCYASGQALLKAPWDWADLTGVKMNGEDKELLWRYRFALTKDNKALTKCLISVDWSCPHEVFGRFAAAHCSTLQHSTAT